MAEQITGNEVLTLIDKAVDARGANYVYLDEHTVCQNWIVDEFADGAKEAHAACIAGQVYDFLDLKPENTGQGTVLSSVQQVAETTGREFTPEAVVILRAAQAVQDDGGTWGQARSAAYGVYDVLHQYELTKREVAW